jgi:hypothetical protein
MPRLLNNRLRLGPSRKVRNCHVSVWLKVA